MNDCRQRHTPPSDAGIVWPPLSDPGFFFPYAQRPAPSVCCCLVRVRCVPFSDTPTRALRGLGAQRREPFPARQPLLLPADAGSPFGNGGLITVLVTDRFDGANGAPCKVCMCSHDDGLSSFIQVSIPFLCESFLRRFSESNQCCSPIY